MPRILIVDDEPAIVRGLEDNLRFEGYETTATTNGEEGLARAVSEAPDLILLDVMMPRLSGWDVCRESRRVVKAGVELHLLVYFVAHRGETLTRERLLDEVWGYERFDTHGRRSPRTRGGC